jgi:serine/threonine protein kinase
MPANTVVLSRVVGYWILILAPIARAVVSTAGRFYKSSQERKTLLRRYPWNAADVRPMSGEIISHYRVHEKLGGGGMGVGYSAEDTKLRLLGALKLLPDDTAGDPYSLERFRREARAASTLNYPNICISHDIDEDQGQGHHFLVMEFLDGRRLKYRSAQVPIPLDELLEIAIQVSTVLDAAHAKGVTHHDIKPANIFLVRQRQAKVLDFGLVNILSAHYPSPGITGSALPTASDQELLSGPGSAMGTVA